MFCMSFLEKKVGETLNCVPTCQGVAWPTVVSMPDICAVELWHQVLCKSISDVLLFGDGTYSYPES